MLRQRAQLLLSRTSSVASTARNRACDNKKNAVNISHRRSTAVSLPAHISLSYRAVSTMSTSESNFSSSSFWNTTTALIAATVATTVLATSDYVSPNKTTDCCGIVGVIGTKDHADAREFLLDGLTILKNRGYDSAGIATVPIRGEEIHITKFASDGDKADSIELVADHSQHLGHTMGIAHTRWCVISLLVLVLVLVLI
jgi:hypothetical protein